MGRIIGKTFPKGEKTAEIPDKSVKDEKNKDKKSGPTK